MFNIDEIDYRTRIMINRVTSSGHRMREGEWKKRKFDIKKKNQATFADLQTYSIPTAILNT